MLNGDLRNPKKALYMGQNRWKKYRPAAIKTASDSTAAEKLADSRFLPERLPRGGGSFGTRTGEAIAMYGSLARTMQSSGSSHSPRMTLWRASRMKPNSRAINRLAPAPS